MQNNQEEITEMALRIANHVQAKYTIEEFNIIANWVTDFAWKHIRSIPCKTNRKSRLRPIVTCLEYREGMKDINGDPVDPRCLGLTFRAGRNLVKSNSKTVFNRKRAEVFLYVRNDYGLTIKSILHELLHARGFAHGKMYGLDFHLEHHLDTAAESLGVFLGLIPSI